jgi:hypothetical protein
MKANQEKTECISAMHVLAAPHSQASDVLHGARKRVTCKESIRALEDRFWDQQLAIGYCSQLKTRTQDNGESLQQFATATEQFIHCAFPALLEDQVRRGPGKAFVNRIRD